MACLLQRVSQAQLEAKGSLEGVTLGKFPHLSALESHP